MRTRRYRNNSIILRHSILHRSFFYGCFFYRQEKAGFLPIPGANLFPLSSTFSIFCATFEKLEISLINGKTFLLAMQSRCISSRQYSKLLHYLLFVKFFYRFLPSFRIVEATRTSCNRKTTSSFIISIPDFIHASSASSAFLLLIITYQIILLASNQSSAKN